MSQQGRFLVTGSTPQHLYTPAPHSPAQPAWPLLPSVLTPSHLQPPTPPHLSPASLHSLCVTKNLGTGNGRRTGRQTDGRLCICRFPVARKPGPSFSPGKPSRLGWIDQGWVGAAVEGMGGALRPSQAQAPQAGWWASTWSYPDIPMHVHTRRRTHVYHAHKCTHRHIDTNTGIMHMCHEHTHATRGHIQEAHMHTRSKCTHMYTRGQHTCTHMYTKAHTHIHAQALRRRGAKTKEQLPTFSPERPSRPIPSPATECQTAGESGG